MVSRERVINQDIGPVMLAAGVKAANIGGKKGNSSVVFPVGGGVKRHLAARFALYAEGHSAPDPLTSSVKNFVKANGGVSWSPRGH